MKAPIHVVRHAFASRCMIKNGDLYRLQKHLVHSDTESTQRYTRLSPGHLAAGVQFFGSPAEADGHDLVTNAAPAPAARQRSARDQRTRL